jgi:hypothetical protein
MHEGDECNFLTGKAVAIATVSVRNKEPRSRRTKTRCLSDEEINFAEDRHVSVV